MGDDMFAPGGYVADGRYRIDGVLGSGGMAAVHRAWDTSLSRPVAIKTLLVRPEADSEAATRFQREARAMAGLSHPHVVTVFDTGAEPQADGPPVPYFVMELVTGPSLAAWLRERGALPVAEAVRIADQVLAALQASHARGMVHRDIKPANVLLSEDGTAKVADFGIVRAGAGAADGTALTGTGFTIGTPEYMSPEQIQGLAEIDGRSDLYAVGLLLFEMLTGLRPFAGANRLTIGYHHVHEPPPTLAAAGLPGQPRLEGVLTAALAKLPEHRPRDAATMRTALTAATVPHPATELVRPATEPAHPAPLAETLTAVAAAPQLLGALAPPPRPAFAPTATATAWQPPGRPRRWRLRLRLRTPRSLWARALFLLVALLLALLHLGEASSLNSSPSPTVFLLVGIPGLLCTFYGRSRSRKGTSTGCLYMLYDTLTGVVLVGHGIAVLFALAMLGGVA
ncbi:protein kinase [Streptomyces sp. NBC_00193]|uniref:protein kinase domain-containing protein n=1 Tax=Streptomyces sp. NBC_00193 TaxID=2975675 RepID=UPI00224E6428|nr:protein kinase [Streptomyces sp. NBC_00193]MCX5295345.1 protein kinase [Streptomyces sp. NBC_00193]